MRPSTPGPLTCALSRAAIVPILSTHSKQTSQREEWHDEPFDSVNLSQRRPRLVPTPKPRNAASAQPILFTGGPSLADETQDVLTPRRQLHLRSGPRRQATLPTCRLRGNYVHAPRRLNWARSVAGHVMAAHDTPVLSEPLLSLPAINAGPPRQAQRWSRDHGRATNSPPPLIPIHFPAPIFAPHYRVSFKQNQ